MLSVLILQYVISCRLCGVVRWCSVLMKDIQSINNMGGHGAITFVLVDWPRFLGHNMTYAIWFSIQRQCTAWLTKSLLLILAHQHWTPYSYVHSQFVNAESPSKAGVSAHDHDYLLFKTYDFVPINGNIYNISNIIYYLLYYPVRKNSFLTRISSLVMPCD